MPEAGRTEIKGVRKHICSSCELVFLEEELGIRYSLNKQKCIRCLIVEKLNKGEIELPSCYGHEYDGALQECSQLCSAREACIIQMMEDRTWELSQDGKKSSGGRMTYQQICVRILRVAGRPMHWQDMWPILEKQTRGRYTNNGDRTQLTNIRTHLKSNRNVVFLGDNYYMWAAIWKPDMGGRLGYKRCGYVREKEVKSLDQILREMSEQDNK